MTIAKANTKVEDTVIKTIVIGDAYLEKGKKDNRLTGIRLCGVRLCTGWEVFHAAATSFCNRPRWQKHLAQRRTC